MLERDKMTHIPANDTGNRPLGSHVGPYWFVLNGSGETLLIAHRCALAEAEKYGDFLTGPKGHYELWEEWRAGPPPERLAGIVHEAEYEEWPRGRVVFNFVKGQFIVYGDKQVFEHKLQDRVLEHFGVPADQVEFSKDGHYQSTRSLSPVDREKSQRKINDRIRPRF